MSTDISRANLFGKLNDIGYGSIESATKVARLRANAYVELAHWIDQIVNQQDSDLHRIVRHFELDGSRLASDITASLDRLPTGATAISDFSDDVSSTVERGWVYSTLLFGDASIRTGHLIVGALKTPNLARRLESISPLFGKLSLERLCEDFDDIVGGSPEDRLDARDGFRLGTGDASGVEGGEGDGMAPAAMGKREALERYTTSLTDAARRGKGDPIVGRDTEIRQMIDVLMRRRQNNPILTGEAGVGKTAVVEGFAQRIARGDVPPALVGVDLRALDIGLLQAGASMKGEFEKRLRQVIEEVQASATPIILFIDEAHTLIGAGGAAGTGDAANLLKPALARGELRTVAATTWAEYKQHIEKDPALTRRFEVVKVEEPVEPQAVLMLRGIVGTMEAHHQLEILDEALESAVRLSSRYIPARQLPDKAVSLLDTAAARVSISRHAVPPALDDARKRIEALEREQGIVEREGAVGMDTSERLERVTGALAEERERERELSGRWDAERALMTRILEVRASLRGDAEAPETPATSTADGVAGDAVANDVVDGGGSADDEDSVGSENESTSPATRSAGRSAEPPSGAERESLLAELTAARAELAAIQGDAPLILADVDAQAVAAVVQDWTGVPVGRMVKNEIETVLNLVELMNRRIIGQRHALEMIAKRIQTSRAHLDNPDKPIGVFMLAGSSGVGKTETALALADTLYGGEQNIITINMSEFQEAHTVSTLKGAPPGYVGYGEGGVLTEAVRRRPYSVVLLDEVEKAHSDVHEIFFQVFDKGWMEDGEGRVIDFRNTLILLTTNAGTDLIMGLCKDPELMPSAEGMATALREPLLKVFPPALLGRLVTIPYYPLDDGMIGRIAALQLGRIQRRVREQHAIDFDWDEDVVALITRRCSELDSGGRMIDAILTNTMLPAVSRELLERQFSDGDRVARIRVSVADDGFAYEMS